MPGGGGRKKRRGAPQKRKPRKRAKASQEPNPPRKQVRHLLDSSSSEEECGGSSKGPAPRAPPIPGHYYDAKRRRYFPGKAPGPHRLPDPPPPQMNKPSLPAGVWRSLCRRGESRGLARGARFAGIGLALSRLSLVGRGVFNSAFSSCRMLGPFGPGSRFVIGSGVVAADTIRTHAGYIAQDGSGFCLKNRAFFETGSITPKPGLSKATHHSIVQHGQNVSIFTSYFGGPGRPGGVARRTWRLSDRVRDDWWASLENVDQGFRCINRGSVFDAAVSPEYGTAGTSCVALGTSKGVSLFDFSAGKWLPPPFSGAAVLSCDYHCSGELFVGTRRGFAGAIDPRVRRNRPNCRVGSAITWVSAIGRDKSSRPNTFVTAGVGGSAALWDRRSPRSSVREYRGHINSMSLGIKGCLDERNCFLFLGGEDGLVRTWNLGSGVLVSAQSLRRPNLLNGAGGAAQRVVGSQLAWCREAQTLLVGTQCGLLQLSAGRNGASGRDTESLASN